MEACDPPYHHTGLITGGNISLGEDSEKWCFIQRRMLCEYWHKQGAPWELVGGVNSWSSEANAVLQTNRNAQVPSLCTRYLFKHHLPLNVFYFLLFKLGRIKKDCFLHDIVKRTQVLSFNFGYSPSVDCVCIFWKIYFNSHRTYSFECYPVSARLYPCRYMESFPALKAKIKRLELAAVGTHLGESFSCFLHRSILFLSC